MFWTFLATFVVLAAFMLILALGTIVGRRKRECSCKLAAQIMMAKTSSDRARATHAATDSPLKILDQNVGCQANNQRC
jgi:hypothetical protein